MAPRSSADVLSTLENAWVAIAEMPRVLTDAGIRFSVVETYEEDVAAQARDSVPRFAGRNSLASLRVPE
jgi:hypothetical protein